VSAVMRDTGLTHGGFYKHFRSKDDLLVESLREAFREFTDTLVRAAKQSPSGEAWKAIVKTYLRPEMCEYPEHGCPLATLAPELARVDRRMKPQIVAELVNYKSRMVPFMPGRRTVDKERAFFAIFSTMIGAIEIARMLPDPTVREKVLGSARDFLVTYCFRTAKANLRVTSYASSRQLPRRLGLKALSFTAFAKLTQILSTRRASA
jgi:TetR/AcrR family transcriptional regulator, transcriptional repressor for nem operon